MGALLLDARAAAGPASLLPTRPSPARTRRSSSSMSGGRRHISDGDAIRSHRYGIEPSHWAESNLSSRHSARRAPRDSWRPRAAGGIIIVPHELVRQPL
eukprot:scaffold689_cov375-Prasinococcus_capsulatus_cf.AAC.13